MAHLPPHLRQVLGARALLPRIGGAAFMDGGSGMAATDLGVLQRKPAAAAMHAPGVTAAAAAAAAAEGGAAAAADGAVAVLLQRQAAAPPRSPRPDCGAVTPRDTHPPLPPGRSSGAVTPTGAVYRQGSMGAQLVAEALRQELTLQLAAAAGTGHGGLGVSLRSQRQHPRSRSRSPLPAGHAEGSRHSTGSADAAYEQLLQLQQHQPGSLSARSSANGRHSPGAAPPEPLVPIFPGLRRARTDAAQGSGAATPRLVVPLAPPPRRSNHLAKRVQEQVRGGWGWGGVCGCGWWGVVGGGVCVCGGGERGGGGGGCGG